jgi:hypothetical protein
VSIAHPGRWGEGTTIQMLFFHARQRNHKLAPAAFDYGMDNQVGEMGQRN